MTKSFERYKLGNKKIYEKLLSRENYKLFVNFLQSTYIRSDNRIIVPSTLSISDSSTSDLLIRPCNYIFWYRLVATQSVSVSIS